MHQKCGRRSLISSRVLAGSPSSLGMGVRARLYSAQGGKAQIMSCANMGMGSQLQTSAQMVGSALGSRSRLITSQPSSAKARPTDPVQRTVPAWHPRFPCQAGRPTRSPSEGGPAASELKVAKGAFPEGPSVYGLLVKEPRVAAPETCWTAPHLGRTSLFWKHQEKRGPDRATWSSSWARCRPTPEAASSCHSRATQRGALRSLRR